MEGHFDREGQKLDRILGLATMELLLHEKSGVFKTCTEAKVRRAREPMAFFSFVSAPGDR